MADHAKLAPSASSRWMTCPGSVTLIERHDFVSTTNEAAQLGTEAHELAENILKAIPDNFDGDHTEHPAYLCHIPEYSDWHKQMVDPYIEYILSIPGYRTYENIVYIDQHCWGTADCIINQPEQKTLHVIDLKTGRIPVHAENNTQLLLYGLGSWMAFCHAGHLFEKVVLTIVQPSTDSISTWEIDIDTLNSFSVQYEASVEKILTQPEVYNVSEKACKWCPAKVVCPAFEQHIQKLAEEEFTENILDEALAEWLDKLPMLKSIISAVEAEAKSRMKAFRDIPGYALSNPRRSYSYDEEEVWRIARKRGLVNVLCPRVPITPAKARKLDLGKSIERMLENAVEVKLGDSSIIKQK